MKFMPDGQSFDLTPDLVRRRLEGAVLEKVREYSADFDGIGWPVKRRPSY